MSYHLITERFGNSDSIDAKIADQNNLIGSDVMNLIDDWMDTAAGSEESNWKRNAARLVGKLKTKDIETTRHALRVAAFSVRLAIELEIKKDDFSKLWLGSLLHDIGKSKIPNRILKKKGALSEKEWIVMRTHAAFGKDILKSANFPEDIWIIAAQHHERYDGCGYPEGLEGDDIHTFARIFSVADCFEAITSDRCYRMKQNYQAARAEIVRVSGSQFDPSVVEAFCKIPQTDWSEERILLKKKSYER